MRLQRREFLTLVGVGSTLSFSALAIDSHGQASASPDLCIYNEALAMGRSWATLASKSGSEVVATSGDLYAVCDRLLRASNREVRVLSGLTTGMEAYALSEVLQAYGYRLTQQRLLSDSPSTAGVREAHGQTIESVSDPRVFDQTVLWRLERTATKLRNTRTL